MPASPARFAALLMALLVCLSAATPASAGQGRKLSQRDVARTITEADKLAAEGRLEEARQTLSAALEKDPSQAAIALKLAGTCEALGDWDCVSTASQIAATGAQGPEKAQAHAGLAAAHLRAGRHGDAVENARMAIELEPSLAAAHVTLAAGLSQQRDPGALAAAQKAVEVAPSSPLAHAVLGATLAGEGQAAAAEGAFRKALELDPNATGAHAGLAQLQFAAGDHAAAIASATSALGRDDSLGPLYSLRGRARFAAGDADGALQDLQRAVTLQPQDEQAHTALGDLHLARKSLDLASSHYRRAVSINPQLAPAHLGLAETMVAYRQMDSARDSIEQAARLLPDSAKAQHLLGVLREHQKQPEEALAAFQKAAALDPQMASAHHGVGRILREHKKDAPGSVASLEMAASLAPEDPDILTDYAVALYDAKQGEKAIPYLQKAVATPDYKNPMGLAVLGLALKDRQSFGDALGYFERAAELAPKWWLPHWGAAWSHFALIKPGCPCGAADEDRVKKMKAHYDQMTSLEGKDDALQTRLQALVDGQKIR